MKVKKILGLTIAAMGLVSIAGCDDKNAEKPKEDEKETIDDIECFVEGKLTQNGDNELLTIALDNPIFSDIFTGFKSSISASDITLNIPGKRVVSVNKIQDDQIEVTVSGTANVSFDDLYKEYTVTIAGSGTTTGAKAEGEVVLYKAVEALNMTLAQIHDLRVNNSINTVRNKDIIVEGKVTYVSKSYNTTFYIQSGMHGLYVVIHDTLTNQYNDIIEVGANVKLRGRAEILTNNLELHIRDDIEYEIEVSRSNNIYSYEPVTIETTADYAEYDCSVMSEKTITLTPLAGTTAYSVDAGDYALIIDPSDVKTAIDNKITADGSATVKISGIMKYSYYPSRDLYGLHVKNVTLVD